MFTLEPTCLVGIGWNEAGIDPEPVASNQAFVDATLHNGLEKMPKNTALTEAAITVLGKGGMIRHRVGQVEPAKPPVGQV